MSGKKKRSSRKTKPSRKPAPKPARKPAKKKASAYVFGKKGGDYVFGKKGGPIGITKSKAFVKKMVQAAIESMKPGQSVSLVREDPASDPPSPSVAPTADPRRQSSPGSFMVIPTPTFNKETSHPNCAFRFIVTSDFRADADGNVVAGEILAHMTDSPNIEGNARLFAESPGLRDSLREVTAILIKIYRGEEVAGTVCDAIDLAQARLRQVGIVVP